MTCSAQFNAGVRSAAESEREDSESFHKEMKPLVVNQRHRNNIYGKWKCGYIRKIRGVLAL